MVPDGVWFLLSISRLCNIIRSNKWLNVFWQCSYEILWKTVVLTGETLRHFECPPVTLVWIKNSSFFLRVLQNIQNIESLFPEFPEFFVISHGGNKFVYISYPSCKAEAIKYCWLIYWSFFKLLQISVKMRWFFTSLYISNVIKYIFNDWNWFDRVSGCKIRSTAVAMQV